MLTLVAAVLAYDRALEILGRLSSPLRSRYVRSETSDEKDILCGRFCFFVVKERWYVVGSSRQELAESREDQLISDYDDDDGRLRLKFGGAERCCICYTVSQQGN